MDNQAFSRAPIYQIINAVNQYNRRIELYKSNCNFVENASDFYFIRRSWQMNKVNDLSYSEDNYGHFHFTNFTANKFNADEISRILLDMRSIEKNTSQPPKKTSSEEIQEKLPSIKPIWDRFFGILYEETSNKFLEKAIDWLKEKVITSTSQEVSGKDFQELFHHYLLQIFTHIPIDGLILGSLYGYHSRKNYNYLKKLKIQKWNKPPLAYLVESKEDDFGFEIWNTSFLNRLEMFIPRSLKQGAVWSEERKRKLNIRNKNEEKELQQIFMYLFRLFHNLDDNIIKTPRDYNITDKKTLWIPVYEESINGVPRGWFLGWLYQSLPNSNSQQTLKESLRNRDFETLERYILNCFETANLLSKDIYAASIREILGQKLETDEKCSLFLCRNLHLMEGWQTTEIEESSIPNSIVSGEKYFYFDESINSLYLALCSSPVDKLEENTRNFYEDENEVIKLECGKDFLPFEKQDHFVNIVNRIRSLYEQIKHNKMLIEIADEKAKQTMTRSLSAIFAHSFAKVASALNTMYRSLLPEISSSFEKEAKALKYGLDWYESEMKKFYWATKNEETFTFFSKKPSSRYKKDLPWYDIEKLIYFAYLQAVGFFMAVPQYEQQASNLTINGYKKDFCWLEHAKSISSNKDTLMREAVDPSLRKTIKENTFLNVSSYQPKIWLLQPRWEVLVSTNDHKEKLKESYKGILDKIIIELFTNALKELGGALTGANLAINVSIETTSFGCHLFFENEFVDKIKLKEDKNFSTGEFFKPEAPSSGVQGLGLYGIRILLENILGIGEFSVRGKLETEKFEARVSIKPDFIYLGG